MEFNTEDIREMEPILLLKYVEEYSSKDAIKGRPLSPSEIIASALIRITSLHNQVIKKELGLGSWVCGTYMSNQRKNLTCIISAYSEEQLNQFIEFCCCKNSKQTCSSSSEDEATKKIKELLALRPKACVHPPLYTFLDK